MCCCSYSVFGQFPSWFCCNICKTNYDKSNYDRDLAQEQEIFQQQPHESAEMKFPASSTTAERTKKTEKSSGSQDGAKATSPPRQLPWNS